MGIEEIIIEMAKQEGELKGSQKQQIFFVENLLRSTDFDDEKIASLAGVPAAFVEEVKKKLKR